MRPSNILNIVLVVALIGVLTGSAVLAWGVGDCEDWSRVTRTGVTLATGATKTLDPDDPALPGADCGSVFGSSSIDLEYTQGDDSYLEGQNLDGDGPWARNIWGEFVYYEKTIQGRRFRMVLFSDGDYQIWEQTGPDEKWTCREMGNQV